MRVHLSLFVYFKPKFSDPRYVSMHGELAPPVTLFFYIKINNRISLMQDMLRLAHDIERLAHKKLTCADLEHHLSR